MIFFFLPFKGYIYVTFNASWLFFTYKNHGRAKLNLFRIAISLHFLMPNITISLHSGVPNKSISLKFYVPTTKLQSIIVLWKYTALSHQEAAPSRENSTRTSPHKNTVWYLTIIYFTLHSTVMYLKGSIHKTNNFHGK